MPTILFLALIPFLISAFSQPAEAQQQPRIPRIAYISNARFSQIAYRVDGFRRGMRELGYVEGKNILIEWREGTSDQIPAIVVDLVRLKIDVIVTAAVTVTRAAKTANSLIPIVMAQDSDPVRNGFVESLARPGGNITGLSTLAPELNGKKLEILKEVAPKISRVAVFASTAIVSPAQTSRDLEVAAAALNLKIQYQDILRPEDFETAFTDAIKGHADAIFLDVAGPVSIPNRKRTAELAIKSRLPAMYRRIQDVEAGGLMTYGVSISDLDRRAATYVDKILKGAKPADLPVEQPTKFEFVINLRAAEQIGLTIPPNVLARADKVIR